MINIPYNDIYKKQNNKLIPSSIKKGIISNVNPQTWTADVQIVGSNQSVIKNIPLASNLNPDLILPGDKCKLDLFDEQNPNDMVVAYTYGRRIANSSGQNQYTVELVYTTSQVQTFSVPFRPTQIFFYGFAVKPSTSSMYMVGQAGSTGSKNGASVSMYFTNTGVVGQFTTDLTRLGTITNGSTIIGGISAENWSQNSVALNVTVPAGFEIDCNIIILG